MARRIPEAFIEELKEKNDIVSVVSPYVALKRKGKTYVGLCPFHNEKTPSFNVYPENNSYYCFGCGAGGEIISFVQRIENLDFSDAVKSLAERSGMALPEDNFDDSLSKKRKRMYELNKEAAKFFNTVLYSPEGKPCLDYYLKRGYTQRTIRHFGMGYAPDKWDSLLKHLRGLGYSYEETYEANLARKSEKNGSVRYYDNFRNRAMVPIIDVQGRVVAFGGRVLDDSKPKYINTSDTLIYKKSLGVFALNFAKNGSDKTLMVVEGYMDVIALHQAGFTNTVAALGTAFTPEMARLISRYADEILLCFDNDEAGREATERAIRIFSSAGIKLRVIKMTGGKDPDEILKKYGPEKFKSFITGSSNDIEYKILESRRRFDLDSSDGKLNFLKEVAVILSETDDLIACDVYASKICEELSVSKDTLMQKITQASKKRRSRENNEKFRAIEKQFTGEDKVNPQKKQFFKAANAEECLISSLMRNNDFWSKIKDDISPEDFLTDFNRKIFRILIERLSDGKSTDLTSLAAEGLTLEETDAVKKIEMRNEKMNNTVTECKSYIAVIKQEKENESLSRVPASQMSDEEFAEAFARLKKK